MNNYHEVSEVSGMNNKEYNMKELSSQISCDNMYLLSKKYTDNQRFLFDANINMELCNSHYYYNENLDNIKGMENNILSGMSIGKKSCIYKKPGYNKGDWEFQYGASDTLQNQSKAKTSKKIKEDCPISKMGVNFKSLGECEKGPFSTYVNTFTTDYDNCV
jgi:hypothetical protein